MRTLPGVKARNAWRDPQASETTDDTRGRLATIGDNRSGFGLNNQRTKDLTIIAQSVE
jgi:hypothetical protein